MKVNISPKKVLVEKANSAVVLATAITAFVVVFSLVASKALLDQRSYQSRVIAKKVAALDQLKQNVEATNSLVTSYQTFVASSQNVIGGNSSGEGERDGDNARIVLDALPSKYDFPAVATSLEKLLNNSALQIEGITGSDDELAQQATETSAAPQPVEIPFGVTATGAYESVQTLINNMQNSIRPIVVQELTLSGSNSNLAVKLNGVTYYQPQKSLDITTEVVE